MSNALIRIGDLQSVISSNNKSIMEGVFQRFRHVTYNDHPQSFFAARKRKNRRYTVTNFISREGVFPTGLLQYVKEDLEKHSIPYEIADQRVVFHSQMDHVPVTSNILKGDITLHDYQVAAANIALEKKQGIIKCPTGGGKTIIMASILKAFQGQYPALILCRNVNLVIQTYESFIKSGIENVGRVNMLYDEPKLITCSTVQSLHKIKHIVQQTKIVMLDEVHEWGTIESAKILQQFTNATYRLGFSATPHRHNDTVHNLRLASWTGPILFDIPTSILQTRSILSEARVFFHKVPTPRDINYRMSYHEVETKGIIENEVFHRSLVEIVNNIPEGRILIFVKRIAHGNRLKELIPDAYWIKGDDTIETREHVLQELRLSNKKKVVAIMSSIGFYGLNVYVHHLINASGGKDPNMLIQKIGRGLRKSFDKDILEYHDFMFEGENCLKNHSLQRIEVLKGEGHTVQVEKLKK